MSTGTRTIVASSCTNDVTCIGTWLDRIPGLISSNRTCRKHKAKPTMQNFPFWGNDWWNYWNRGSKHSPQKSFNSWRMCAVSHFIYALTIMSSWSEQELETGRSLLELKQEREMIVHFSGPPFELRVKPKLYTVGSSWWDTGVCWSNTLSLTSADFKNIHIVFSMINKVLGFNDVESSDSGRDPSSEPFQIGLGNPPGRERSGWAGKSIVIVHIRFRIGEYGMIKIILTKSNLISFTILL